MAEKNQSSKNNHSNSLKWYIGIFIGVIIIFLIGIWINIGLLNEQFDKNEKPISSSKQSTNPLINLKIDSKSIYKLKEEDLQKFNDHIVYLTDKVEGEVKRTQENNQYDIDRINTFLALGIGLLAIIGGLLPIFVNYFSKEHLEKRMKDYEKDSKQITTDANLAKKIAGKAKAVAVNATQNINRIEIKIDQLGSILVPLKTEVENVKEATKKIPYIDLLVFQNAVAKLTSSDALKLFIGSSRYSDVAAYLQNLASAMDSFDSDLFVNNPNFDEAYFINIITELKLTLRLGPIRRIPDGRSFQIKIDEAVLQLDEFDKMETKDFSMQLKVVSRIINELENLVKSKMVIVNI
jgi:hypothetical protein